MGDRWPVEKLRADVERLRLDLAHEEARHEETRRLNDRAAREHGRLLDEVERLRAEVAACDGHGYLREEIERLTRERDDEKEKAIWAETQYERLKRERDEAKAEGQKWKSLHAAHVVYSALKTIELRALVGELVEALRARHEGCPGWVVEAVAAHAPGCSCGSGTQDPRCPVPEPEQVECDVCAALKRVEEVKRG